MTLAAQPHVLAVEVDIGTHETAKFLGLTWHWDTILTSVIAGVIVVGLGLYMRKTARSGVPSKMQLLFEMLVSWVNRQVEESMGLRVAPFVAPMAVTLFVYILLCNWIGVLPSGHPEHLPAPTADINLTLTLALVVIVPMHIVSLKRRGLGRYIRHYFEPYKIFFPINVVEELAKPITLALRLFGNIFSGAIMVSLLALMPPYVLWLPQWLWKLIDLGVGVIQAFIFALLTILYYAFATATEGHGASDEHADGGDSSSHQASPTPLAAGQVR
ncbi:MAG: F0F1 ATP synthase subunit A [Acidothermus cellulolyticus]|nr:F0F1 ATP synthase subunit A [Acidothermus cellulolyticus]MCL6550099.1 F0F1 ATP synthase subunit A [Acidothermus cellulolyticus]